MKKFKVYVPIEADEVYYIEAESAEQARDLVDQGKGEFDHTETQQRIDSPLRVEEVK